jgi:hypothetical protein
MEHAPGLLPKLVATLAQLINAGGDIVGALGDFVDVAYGVPQQLRFGFSCLLSSIIASSKKNRLQGE